MKLKTILGKNVKYHRYRKNYTQEKLAELLQVSPNYVGRLERDDFNNLPDRVNLTNRRK